MFFFRRQQTSPTLETADAGAIKWTHEEDGGSPPLVLLVDDAASLASYRVHYFADTASAAEFVQFWFPPEQRASLVAFWALTSEPEDADAETVVCIRNDRDPALVFPFSFLDIEAAHGFVRDETARGLDLGAVCVYHAVPVGIEWTARGVVMSPAKPPAVAAPYAPPVAPRFTFRHLCVEEHLDVEAAREPDVVPAPIVSLHAETRAVSAGSSSFADDLVERVLSVLRIRRWQPRDAAFVSFGSPPGRF